MLAVKLCAELGADPMLLTCSVSVLLQHSVLCSSLGWLGPPCPVLTAKSKRMSSGQLVSYLPQCSWQRAACSPGIRIAKSSAITSLEIQRAVCLLAVPPLVRFGALGEQCGCSAASWNTQRVGAAHAGGGLTALSPH